MAGKLFVGHRFQALDSNGDPYAGGTVEFFEPGTPTNKDVFTDSALTTPASNPVTLDTAGTCQVYLSGDYSVTLKDSTGVQVDQQDNINPAESSTTSGGNLIANGSFETAGTESTKAEGWTLTAQSDGTVERITTDNYDGTASLKFTSDGSGGGQADTESFFAVSPGRNYEVSFALKSSVADIRNIVQVRYFDEDQVFLSSSSVYDEDTSNPTSWEVKSFVETPPANARFAKLRILGADQSDATAGNARFDAVTVKVGASIENRFPNVNADVTATDEELNNADESATAGGGFMKGPTSSTDPSLAFDTWRTPNANRPVLVTVTVSVFTNGSLFGRVDVFVDESGGTTSDYIYEIAFVDDDWSSGTSNGQYTATFLVPSGGSYRIQNASDPTGTNSIRAHREFVF